MKKEILKISDYNNHEIYEIVAKPNLEILLGNPESFPQKKDKSPEKSWIEIPQVRGAVKITYYSSTNSWKLKKIEGTRVVISTDFEGYFPDAKFGIRAADYPREEEKLLQNKTYVLQFERGIGIIVTPKNSKD